MGDQTDTTSEQQSKEARAAGVERMLNDEDPPREPPTNEPAQPGQVPGAQTAGESVTRRGEDVVKEEGKEPGRVDTGVENTPGERPTGESSARDASGVDPQEPVTGSPPQGGQGG